MSKPIKMTEQYLNECREDFEKALKLTKLVDGKLQFTKTFSCGDKKATILFTPEAWAKMAILIKEFDKEVAWHGVARRGEDESKDEYIIEDIVVYPQEVSGTTVEMDTEEYAKWLQDNIDDDRFNNIHMQGHSHVNMGTTPSSVDLNHQEEILNMLGENDFYIFMIWNKSFTSTNKVYDLKKNILFEDKDITVKLVGEDDGLAEFLKSAKEMVKTRTYNYCTTTSNRSGGSASTTITYHPSYESYGKSENSSKKTRTKVDSSWVGKNAGQPTFWDEDDEDEYWSYVYKNGRGI